MVTKFDVWISTPINVAMRVMLIVGRCDTPAAYQQ